MAPAVPADPDNPTPDGAPIDMYDYRRLVQLRVLDGTGDVARSLAKLDDKARQPYERFIMSATSEFLPGWGKFIQQVPADAVSVLPEPYTTELIEHDDAKKAIYERPEIDELGQASDDANDRIYEIERQIIATRATTPGGLAVKRPIIESMLEDIDHPFSVDVFRSIYADVEHCLTRCAS